MDLIPSTVSPRTQSSAEERIFKLLAEMTLPGALALHSLNLPTHQYKIVGEADFVLVTTEGVLVLEVKGGGVACDSRGQWTSTDRRGDVHILRESPYDQAYSAMITVRDLLEQRLDSRDRGRISYGAAIVLPDVDWHESLSAAGLSDPAEIPASCVLDKRSMASSRRLRDAILAAQAEWRKMNHKATLDERMIKCARTVLRPEFHFAAALSWRNELLEEDQVRLTEEQYSKLDVMYSFKRVIVTGGAGTGKTFLALEAAKHYSRKGLRTVLVVPSPVMRASLAPKLEGEKIILAGPESLDGSTKYEVLIVDEAQDVMDFQRLDVLGAALEGSLEAGKWVFFLDPNNQVGLSGSFDEEAYGYLGSYSSGDPVHLHDNCRNTAEIVSETALYTGADIGAAQVSAGLPVIWRDGADRAELVGHLEGWLDGLLSEGISRDAVAIVSASDFEASIFAELPSRWRNRTSVVCASSPMRQPGKAVFASIGDFKGLESPFVALVDYSVKDVEALVSLYVGMTRASTQLWIGLYPEVKNALAANVLARRGGGMGGVNG